MLFLFLTPISSRRQVFMPFLEMVLDNQAVDMDAVKEQVNPLPAVLTHFRP